MKNRRTYPALAILLILCIPLLALNCDRPVDPPSKEVLLSKEWKITEILINNVPDQSTDYNGYRRKFDSAGSYLFTDSPGASSQGTWEFDSNKQNLILDKGTNKQQNVRILILDANNLEMEFTVPANYKNSQQIVVYKLVL